MPISTEDPPRNIQLDLTTADKAVHPPRDLRPAGRDPLGVHISDVDPELTPEVLKELTNKLAWALGSTYKLSYHGKRSRVREAAWDAVKELIHQHGYPEAILAKN